MKTASIGFMREDGDLGLFATLNNLDEYISDDAFNALIDIVGAYIENKSKQKVTVLERNDAPDYVEISIT